MQVIDLSPAYAHKYFLCLEDWSDEMKEAGNHKQLWYQKMITRGLRVKIAVEKDAVYGMIQYIPIEHSSAAGSDAYFINCIWVHGHKMGVGNHQNKGIGTALLKAAEDDARSRNSNGIAAWGISLPFWMKAAWFKKHGFNKVDKDGMAVLMWKPFNDTAVAPKWIRQKKQPDTSLNKVTVTAFINGWCPAQNLVFERAKKASLEFGDKVDFKGIHTCDRNIFLEWGISDGLFVDDKQIRTGPPPSLEKIRKKIAKKVKKKIN